MSVQKSKKIESKIEWTDSTWNPVRGCAASTKWIMGAIDENLDRGIDLKP